jgi:type IV pilus assembly protein PilA
MLSRVRKSLEDKEQGFTLIELLVVIIIIGILAAIAIPVFLSQRQKGWDAAVKSDLRNAATAEETYLTENSVYTTSVANLTAKGFKQSDVGNYFVGNTAIVPTINAGNAYCLVAQSKSGNYFSYGSASGLSAALVAAPGNAAGVCS